MKDTRMNIIYCLFVICLICAVYFIRPTSDVICTNRTITKIEYVPTYLAKDCPKVDCYEQVLQNKIDLERFNLAMNLTK